MTVIYSFFFEEEPTKFYIGKSSSFEERKRAHLNALKRGKHHSSKAQSLFDKYCTEPTFLIIEECLEEQAFDKEVEYIRTFDSYNKGLNCTPGGAGLGLDHTKYGVLYSKRQILKVFSLLINRTLSYEDISLKTGVKIGIIKGIRRGTKHLWLKEEYPDKYYTMSHLRKVIKTTTLLNQGKSLPSYISPEGEIYANIQNLREFVLNLNIFDNPTCAYKEFSSMKNGRAKSYKGWKLYNPSILET